MKLSAMQAHLSALALALVLARPVVANRKIRLGEQGCDLDLSQQVAAEISCGKASAVVFAVESYGADTNELQAWLELAGCTEEEANAEAIWASESCRNAKDDRELRRLRGRNHLQPLRHRADSDSDDTSSSSDSSDESDSSKSSSSDAEDDTDDKTSTSTSTTTSSKSTTSTTLTTSTSSTSSTESTSSSTESTSSTTSASASSTTDLASTSANNQWVMIEQLTANASTTVFATITCMTATHFTTTSCSSREGSGLNGGWHTSCTSYATSTPTCVPGKSCAFSSTNGDISCYNLDGVPVYGIIIFAVFGLAAATMLVCVATLCARERRAVQSLQQDAETKALLASSMDEERTTTKAAAVALADRDTREADAAPLMESGRSEFQTPEIVVTSGHTPTTPYDPFNETQRHASR